MTAEKSREIRALRKLVVLTFMSLDGVMQSPGGPKEDTSGGFKKGGWSPCYWDRVLGDVMGEQMKGPFDLLLGRKTYDVFAAHWPNRPEDPGAKELNTARKYVVSRKPRRLTWANSELVTGNVAQKIKKLKQGDGPEIQVHGSANLIQTLLKNDLVDEFRLKIFPVTLGPGKRLFAEGTIPAGLKLLDSKTSTTGVIVASYVRAGDVKTGSFAS